MKTFIFLLSLIFSTFTLASTNEYVAKVFHRKGKAYLSVMNGPFGKIVKGDLLSEGNQVKTGDNGLIIIRFPDKSVIRVGPSSIVKIEKISEVVSGKTLTPTNILLKKGSALINVINKNKAPIFNVKTKFASVGVRGTNFLTSIDSDSSNLDIAVEKGEIEVRSNLNKDQADSITAGHGVVLEKGELFTQPKKYDWISNVNFKALDTKISPKYFNRFVDIKNLEFRNKRQKWNRDAKKWLNVNKRWERNRKDFLKDVKSLKGPKKEFLKRKRNFLKEKRTFDLQRNKHFRSLQKINLDAKKLKLDKEKWRRDVEDYKKKGVVNNKELKRLKRRKDLLNNKTISLNKKINFEKDISKRLSSGQIDIGKSISKYSKKINKKQIEKQATKQFKKNVNRQIKKSSSDAISKGLRGLFK
jgi:hypothetical protein